MMQCFHFFFSIFDVYQNNCIILNIDCRACDNIILLLATLLLWARWLALSKNAAIENGFPLK